MKKLLIMLFPCLVYAEGLVFDPTVVSERTLTCILPTEYTDNSPLPASDILSIDFYRGRSPIGPWELAHSSIGPVCSFVEDITTLELGQYYHHAVTRDIFGRSSEMSNIIPSELQVHPDPKPPVLLGWQ